MGHPARISLCRQQECPAFENHEGWGSRFHERSSKKLRWASPPSYPPLQKPQERGTHSLGSANRRKSPTSRRQREKWGTLQESPCVGSRNAQPSKTTTAGAADIMSGQGKR